MKNRSKILKGSEIELDKLLSEDIATAKIRESSEFDQAVGPFNNKLILFGAGCLGKKMLTGLRKVGIEPIFVSDNNPTKWNQSIDGVGILPPEEAAEKFSDSAAFIVTICSPNNSYLKIKKQLTSLGCLRILPFIFLFWKFPDIFLPYYSIDLPSKILQQATLIRKVFSLLNDEESRRQYISHIRWRLFSEYDVLPEPSYTDQYFPADIIQLDKNEVFVDCGAFDGDTINKFLRVSDFTFKKVVVFEPDPTNFYKLKKYFLTLPDQIRNRIRIASYAVGKNQGKMLFNSLGDAGSAVINTGHIEVDCISLDEELLDDMPSFLKIDIEGAEAAALEGAQNIIKTFKPIIAICVYHRPPDLWQIPLFLNQLNTDYLFYLRAHENDGFEVVLYAVPLNRLLSSTT
jgi:FkbM family methyltransferase